MRTHFLVSVGSVFLAAAACGDTASESNGEITSQQDVQQFFQTIMPDLVATLTDLADGLSIAQSSTTEKGAGASSSTVPCPGGGSLGVNLNTGQATLAACSVGGVTISAPLTLFVYNTGLPGSYQAQFSGTLVVSGTFNGTVQVIQALIQWMDPATAANIFWDVTVMIGEETFSAVGGGGSLDCEPYTPVTPEPGNGPCDDDSDCQSHSCRDPADNPSEGCTCRHPDGTGGTGGAECPAVDVDPGSVALQGACDDEADCQGGLPCIDCICI